MCLDGEGQERGKIECESEGVVLVFGMTGCGTLGSTAGVLGNPHHPLHTC